MNENETSRDRGKRTKIILIGGIALAVCLVGAAAFFAIRFFYRGSTGPIGSSDNTRTAVKLLWDVPASHPDYAAIAAAVKYGVVPCKPDGSFRSDNTVTRAEFASMIAHATGLEAAAPAYSVFYDLTPDNPYYGYVEPASKYLAGYEDQIGKYFKPADDVSREDVAVAIVKAAGIDPKTADLTALTALSDKSDLSDSVKASAAICVKNGWLRPAGDKFDPKGPITRADAAVLMNLFIESRLPKATGSFGITTIH